MARLIENYIPVVKWDGLNSNKPVDFSGAATVKLPAGTTIAGVTAAGATTITSAGANALAVGPSGASNPTLNVDASTASAISGLQIKGAATGVAVALSTTDSGSNAGMTIDGKGTGTLKLNSISTTAGIVTIGNSTALAGAVINGPVQVNNKPVAVNATATLTAAQVAAGYITSTSAAAVTMTMPTGTLLGAQLGAVQGTVFDLVIDNTAGANTVTVAVAVNGILSAAAAANAASQGLLTIPSGVTGQGCFRLMFSSATAYTFTRIA